MGHRSGRAFFLNVLETSAPFSRICLPGDLQKIAELSPSPDLTAERLIRDHTQFSYFERFISQQTWDTLQVGLLLGWKTRVRFPAFLEPTPARTLRYCPECAASSMSKFGAAGWQRIHNLPAVRICSEHYVVLEESPWQRSNIEFLSIPRPSSSGSNKAAPDLVLDSISTNTTWLVRNPAPPLLGNAMRYAVAYYLRNAGWMEGNRLREGFRRSLIDDLGYRLLGECDAHITPRPEISDWVRQILAPSRIWDIHPIRFLLLLAFLRCDCREFFDTAESAPVIEVQLFDEGFAHTPMTVERRRKWL
jgi:hypothetical protein